MNEQSTFRFLSNINSDINVTTSKIKGFKKLKPGWNFGEGVNFKPIIIKDAISLNEEALAYFLLETDAFPGTNGEIMVTIYNHDHCAEFVIEPNRQITFRYEERDSEIHYKGGLSLNDAKTQIRELYKQWNGLESSTNAIMIDGEEDLSPWRLDQEVMPASPLLTTNAYSKTVDLFAGISPDIIRRLRTNRRFFGYSDQKYYLPIAS